MWHDWLFITPVVIGSIGSDGRKEAMQIGLKGMKPEETGWEAESCLIGGV